MRTTGRLHHRRGEVEVEVEVRRGTGTVCLAAYRRMSARGEMPRCVFSVKLWTDLFVGWSLEAQTHSVSRVSSKKKAFGSEGVTLNK